jgi:hypothetical protein
LTLSALFLSCSEELVGVPIILKFLTRLGAQQGSDLYGPTPLAACQV